MSKVVRTYSFEEICDIISKHAHKEYHDGKIDLKSINEKVSTRLNVNCYRNDLQTLTIKVYDEYAGC